MANPVTGLPISGLININQPTTNAPASGTSTLDPNAFLQLLVAEFKNQDPTKPQDPTQQITQLAQFSALQYQQQTATAFQQFSSNFGVMQASSLIGKQVTVNTVNGSGNTSTQTGTVSTIDVQNGAPYFTMKDSTGKTLTDNNGQPLLFSTQQIVGIG